LEIRDTIAEQKLREEKRDWQKAVWIGRRFAPLTDEERKDFSWLFDDETEHRNVTYDEALEIAMNVRQKFREADGINKVNPLNG